MLALSAACGIRIPLREADTYDCFKRRIHHRVASYSTRMSDRALVSYQMDIFISHRVERNAKETNDKRVVNRAEIYETVYGYPLKLFRLHFVTEAHCRKYLIR